MQAFQDLDVWRKAHGLVLRIYAGTARLPPTENLGLTLNLRRSAISMATRIAEGAGKASRSEFEIELNRSRAIAFELEYLLLVARDMGFMEASHHEEVSFELIEVRKMISGLIKKLRAVP